MECYADRRPLNIAKLTDNPAFVKRLDRDAFLNVVGITRQPESILKLQWRSIFIYTIGWLSR